MNCAKNCGRRATRRGLCHSHYETYRTRQKAYGNWETLYVDTTEVRCHILKLKAAGMGDRRIAELAGVARNNVREVITGRSGRNRSAKMLRRNANAILAVAPDPAPGAFVDPCGTVRRLRALVAIGYTQSELCGRLGLLPGNGSQLFRGKRQTVVASTAARVTELYEALSMTPGTSNQARQRAKKLGWAPPLAWEDDLIDNPNTKPDLGERRAVPFNERYLELKDCGYSSLQIVNKLGVKPESLLRQLDRYNLPRDPELVNAATRNRQRVAAG